MDCPNCGAYNASNSFRCRRCNHILPADDDAESNGEDDSWGPVSGPEERWEEHFRSDPGTPRDEEPEPEWSESWTTPDPEPSAPADWDIAQGSSPNPWASGTGSESTTPPDSGAYGARSGADIPNYLWPSIGATLCCCAPLGIPAIVFASRVDAFVASGDLAAAEEASNKAKMWALAAAGVSVLFWIAIICTGGFGAGGDI